MQTIVEDNQTAGALIIHNPFTLLQTAIEKGADPDKLGRLVDLVENWQANRAREEYARAMVACQIEMPKVYKDQQNSFLKTQYAAAEAIQEACKPTWLKHGFALSFTEEPEANSELICVRCDVRHVGGHVQSHYGRYPRDGVGAQGGKNMNPLQGTVSAHSYAERDMTTLIFNIIIAGRDQDGSNDPPITEKQVEELLDLIEKCEKAKKPIDEMAFSLYLAKMIGVTHPKGEVVPLGKLRHTHYLTVKTFLEGRARAK